MSRRADGRQIQSVETAVNIIELLQSEEGAGVTHISNTLELSKGTVHSHLATLKNNEYVVKRDGEYHLSLKYLDLAETVKSQVSGYDIVREEVERLATETGELAQFATVEHGRAVYLYKYGGENAVQTASRLGTRESLHCLSLGKAMLAHMTRDRVEDIIDTHGLKRYTPQTITDRDALFEELSRIRERGVAYDEEERIEGIRCVAAPVTAAGDIFGAVSVSGPATRIKGDRFREALPDHVTRTANIIEINTKFS